MTNDELNQGVGEFNPQNENKSFAENVAIKENVIVNENQAVEESIPAPKKAPGKLNEKKKEHALSVLSGGLAATVGAVLVGMTSYVNVKMSADFSDVKYEDGKIVYAINVQDMTEDETLTIYPYRDNGALDAISVRDEDGDGLIEGVIELDKEYIRTRLDSSDNVTVNYVLELKGVVGLNIERSFDRWVVRIDKMTSKFEDVESWCTCSEDGCYNFQMNFEDDNDLFTNFEAWITDDFGNESHCSFTENLHDVQKIYVLDLQGAHGFLHIRYQADGVEADPIDIEINF